MFYGWKVVAALFMVLLFTSGFGFYNHSLLIQGLVRDNGFSIEVASSAVSVFFLVSGVSGLAIAPLLDRWDVRVIVVIGAVLSSIALYSIGEISTTPMLFLVYGIFGIGFAASGLLPATTLVARWFEVQRARALSVASTGLSVGGILITPLSAALLERVTLGEAANWFALVYLVGVVPVAMIVLRSSPADVGLNPDGAAPRAEDKVGSTAGMAWQAAMRHPYFWTLSIAYVGVMTSQVGGIAHQYGLVTERLGASQASFALALLPFFSILGRLAGGYALEYLNTLWFTLVMIVLQALALMTLGFSEQVWLIYAGLSVFGITVGNLLMLQPLIIAEIYGLVSYARLYSFSNLITQAGVAAGPATMGFLFAFGGSYQLPYLVAGIVGIVAAVIFSLARPPK